MSYQVFEQLFPIAEIRNDILNKKVAVVTDNVLSFLPFELLSTSKNELDYLIKESSIRYAYSYSFLQTRKTPSKRDIQFLAMAPVSFKDAQLDKLSNSENEVALLSKYFKGNVFINEEATKANFLRKSENASIIHLATHANTNEKGDNPWISFYDEKINLQELYLESVENALVVLSSCKTSIGKQESGEGVMSLARGFFYAGADSVVASLWNVDDRAANFIINEFYKNLNKGTSKSKALQLAKVKYLKEYSHSELSPYYWASLTVLGNDVPIVVSFNGLYVILLICGILFFAILFLRNWVRK